MEYLELSNEVVSDWMLRAEKSARNREALILHSPGDYHNRVYNFLLFDTYMQPHMHPGDEKIEVIRVLSGSLAALFFNDVGEIIQRMILEPKKCGVVEIPAYAWHTYVMLSNEVVTYETMNGVYDSATWKRLAEWAPSEHSKEAADYLRSLRASLA